MDALKAARAFNEYTRTLYKLWECSQSSSDINASLVYGAYTQL